MSKLHTSLRLLARAIAGLVALSAAQAAAPEQCYADWSAAVPIVQAELLTSVRDLHVQARAHRLGDLVRVTLCVEQGRYVYRLLVRDPSGHIAAVIVDARKPF